MEEIKEDINVSKLEKPNKSKSEKKKKKKKKLSQLVSTFFRNALRSNLDLTSLADTKAGILISINGFILTVSVTASGFAIHNEIMTYAFISIILTSLGSIIFAVLAVKPRHKHKLVDEKHLDGYESLLYYQDMADLEPDEYKKRMKKALVCSKESVDEMITHLHILGAEIKKKYFWLKQAYTFFSTGLVVSAILIIYALVYVEETAFYNLSKGSVAYKKDKFYNVFEPSGAATMSDGKVLIVEDESSVNSLKLIEVENNGRVLEIGNLYLPKKIKKVFKKEVEDLEAITVDGNVVYGVTSHTLSKKKKVRASREKLIMFTYEDGGVQDLLLYSNLKKDLHERFPELFKQSIFSTNDINIEGLAYENVNNTLIIGFRSPMVNSKALLIAIENPKELFTKGEKPRFSKPIRVDLNGMGIRDLTYDAQKSGYWVIAGGSNDRGVEFKLWFLDAKTFKASRVKNHPNIGFGEGVTIINQNTNVAALFIVEDNGQKPNKSADYVIIDRKSL